MSFAQLAERLQPAVVNISTRQSVTVQPAAAAAGLRGFLPPLRRRGAEPGRPGRPGRRRHHHAARRLAGLGLHHLAPTAISSPTTTSSRRPGRTRWSSRSPSPCPTAPNMRPRWSAATPPPTSRVLKVNPRTASALRPLRRFDPDPRRRLGDRDRQSVRARRHRHRRHRLGAAPQHQRRPLRPLHPDRRLDQLGQFGRPDVRHPAAM